MVPPNTARSNPDRSCGANPVFDANPRIASYAKKRSKNGAQSPMKLRPRPRATAMTSSASSVHSGSIETPRQSITPKISARYTTLPISSRRGRRRRWGRTSDGADNCHRRDLDRHRKRKCIRAERRPRVAAGLAEHLHQQVGRSVQHPGLVAESVRREDEADDLGHLLDILQAGGGLHLGPHVEGTDTGPF